MNFAVLVLHDTLFELIFVLAAHVVVNTAVHMGFYSAAAVGFLTHVTGSRDANTFLIADRGEPMGNRSGNPALAVWF